MASAEYQRNRYYKHRQILINEMGGVCVSCGATEGLQFDHIDRELKSFDIAKAFNRKLDYLRLETAKCQLLCEPCHRAKTKKYQDWKCNTNTPQPKDSWEHGTFYTRYTRHCKCKLCIEFSDNRNILRRSGTPRTQTTELVHGTRAGYLKEKRRNLEICDACRKANTDYSRNRK